MAEIKPHRGENEAPPEAEDQFPQQPGEIPVDDVMPAHTEEDLRSAAPSDGTGVSGTISEEPPQ